MNQFIFDDQAHLEECKAADDKYNDLSRAFAIKEQEYANNMNELNDINIKLRKEIELLKSKYEKKIQMLTLNNKELNARVGNLINVLIGLKDYAISIERNMNDISEGNYGFSGVNNNYQNFDNRNKIEGNRELLNNMRNMINQIDNKILNDDRMMRNQMY